MIADKLEGLFRELKLEPAPEVNSIELIELNTALCRSSKFAEGHLLGPKNLNHQISVRKSKNINLNIWGAASLLLGTICTAGIYTYIYGDDKYSEYSKILIFISGLGLITSVSLILKYLAKAIPGLTENYILDSPAIKRLRVALKFIDDLRDRDCQIYVCSGDDQYFKLPRKFLFNKKYTQFLIGNHELRAQFTRNKALINGALYVKTKDVSDLLKRAPAGTGPNSRKCRHLGAFYKNEHLRKQYLKESANWHDEKSPQFRLKLTRNTDTAYHNICMYIAENFNEFKVWVDGGLTGKENTAYQIKVERLLGLRTQEDTSTPIANETRDNFQKLDHRSINTFLKNRNFIKASFL